MADFWTRNVSYIRHDRKQDSTLGGSMVGSASFLMSMRDTNASAKASRIGVGIARRNLKLEAGRRLRGARRHAHVCLVLKVDPRRASGNEVIGCVRRSRMRTGEKCKTTAYDSDDSYGS